MSYLYIHFITAIIMIAKVQKQTNVSNRSEDGQNMVCLRVEHHRTPDGKESPLYDIQVTLGDSSSSNTKHQARRCTVSLHTLTPELSDSQRENRAVDTRGQRRKWSPCNGFGVSGFQDERNSEGWYSHNYILRLLPFHHRTWVCAIALNHICLRV